MFFLNFIYFSRRFLNQKWFFDQIYSKIFVHFFYKIGYSITYKMLDKGFLEWFGPTGIVAIFKNLSLSFFFKLHNSTISLFFNFAFLGVLLIYFLIFLF